jgi:hypothetical protein
LLAVLEVEALAVAVVLVECAQLLLQQVAVER